MRSLALIFLLFSASSLFGQKTETNQFGPEALQPTADGLGAFISAATTTSETLIFTRQDGSTGQLCRISPFYNMDCIRNQEILAYRYIAMHPVHGWVRIYNNEGTVIVGNNLSPVIRTCTTDIPTTESLLCFSEFFDWADAFSFREQGEGSTWAQLNDHIPSPLPECWVSELMQAGVTGLTADNTDNDNYVLLSREIAGWGLIHIKKSDRTLVLEYRAIICSDAKDDTFVWTGYSQDNDGQIRTLGPDELEQAINSCPRYWGLQYKK